MARRCVWSRNLENEEVKARYRAVENTTTRGCNARKTNNKHEIYSGKSMGHVIVQWSDLKLIEVQSQKNIFNALLAEFLYNERKNFQRCSKLKNLACSIST
jgi:hypothetical protein